jgi:cytochrome c551/c552
VVGNAAEVRASALTKDQKSAPALLSVFGLACVVCSGAATAIVGPSMGYGVATTFAVLAILVLASAFFTWLLLRNNVS